MLKLISKNWLRVITNNHWSEEPRQKHPLPTREVKAANDFNFNRLTYKSTNVRNRNSNQSLNTRHDAWSDTFRMRFHQRIILIMNFYVLVVFALLSSVGGQLFLQHPRLRRLPVKAALNLKNRIRDKIGQYRDRTTKSVCYGKWKYK